MGRAQSVSNPSWLVGVLATSNPKTTPFLLLGVARGSVTIRQTPGSTGTLAGSAQAQVTDFGGAQGGDADYGQAPREQDWVNLGASVAISGGTTNRIPLGTIDGKFLRIVWTDTSSTSATLDVAVSATLYT